MNRTGTFERAIKLHQYLLTGRPLTRTIACNITGISRSQVDRYMFQLEAILPVRYVRIRITGMRARCALILDGVKPMPIRNGDGVLEIPAFEE